MKPDDPIELTDAFKLIEASVRVSGVAEYEFNTALIEGLIRSFLRRIDETNRSESWLEIDPQTWKNVKIRAPYRDTEHPHFSPPWPFQGHGKCYLYFARQEIEQRWPQKAKLADIASTAATRRKGPGGRRGDFDWEKCLIEAARWMHHEGGVPAKQADLVQHIAHWFGNDCPSESQLKEHLGPLYLAFKTGEPAG